MTVQGAAAARRPLAKMPAAFAACSAQAVTYGKCVGAKYTDVEKNMCQTEFKAFKQCVSQAMKRK